MSDETAIQQLLNRYTQGCCIADWDNVLATFLPDATWGIAGGPQQKGHAAIEHAMAAFVAQMAYFVQLNSPALIAVDGDRATARSVIRECGKFADRDEALEVLGFYDDELVRTEEGWKFARRSFSAAGLHRFPLAPGPALG